MNLGRSLLVFGATVILTVGPTMGEQENDHIAQPAEVDGTDLTRQMREREEKILKLSPTEQERLRTAQAAALNTPEVKAAVEKRNQAIREFRAILHQSMVKADPSVARILQK